MECRVVLQSGAHSLAGSTAGGLRQGEGRGGESEGKEEETQGSDWGVERERRGRDRGRSTYMYMYIGEMKWNRNE